ncbi:MAG TPA: hypothetical protein VGK52_14495 [Polyangia bacterium]|jgi:hypothetical protein
MNDTNRWKGVLLAAALLVSAGACRSKTDASRADFTRGVRAYLEQRGDLCVGRPRWPVDVAERAGSESAQDAAQLPVLERLGLVASTVLAERRGGVATPFELRRYRLTAAGRKHYIDRETRLPTPPDEPGDAARADFCVVRLELGRVESWDVQQGAPPTALVSYTYRADAPSWTRDAGFQKVFPAVARLLAGAGTAHLVEGFTLTPDGWTANDLLPKASGRPAQAAAP